MEKQKIANQIRQKVAELNVLLEESAKQGLTVNMSGLECGRGCASNPPTVTVEIKQIIEY